MANHVASPSEVCGSTTRSKNPFLCCWTRRRRRLYGAAEQATQRRDQVREVLGRDLDAARYAADRAFRQYDAADPTNRLVAGELEARWNQALVRVAEVESKIATLGARLLRRRSTAPHSPYGHKSEGDLGGADDGCTVEEAHRAHPDPGSRGDIDEAASEIAIVVHWSGGIHSEIACQAPTRAAQQHTGDVIATVRELALIAKDELIAGLLTAMD